MTLSFPENEVDFSESFDYNDIKNQETKGRRNLVLHRIKGGTKVCLQLQKEVPQR
jgi:hypothetical protein